MSQKCNQEFGQQPQTHRVMFCTNNQKHIPVQSGIFRLGNDTPLYTNFTTRQNASAHIDITALLRFILCNCKYGCMFCMLLFNFVNCVFLFLSYVFFCYVYIFLLVCMFCSGYSVSLYCSVHCLCANVYCATATGCQPNCS
jgi:hypothetical protein